MLTELAVVLCLDVASLALAMLLARFTLRRGSAGAEARRLVTAATRASDAFLFRESKFTALGVGCAVALVLGVHGVFLLRRSPGLTLAATLWTAFATVGGAALTLGVAHVTAAVGLRATLRTVRAAQVSLDQAVCVALRGSGVAALVADASSTAAVAVLLGLLYLLGGGGAVSSSAEAALLLERAAAALPGLGLGSVAAALVLGLGGATYHVASEVGALGAPGLDLVDPRNPSMVAHLVGTHVGVGVRRAVDMFAAATLANVVTVMLGVAAFRVDGGASGTRAWALVTLPLVVRGTGVLASGFGLFSAHTREGERGAPALWRGQTTAATLVVGGIAGSALWLVGPHFGWLVAAGAAGVVAGAAVGHAARLRTDRRLRPVQDLLEAARAGQSIAIARGIALGFRGTWLPVSILALALVSAFHFGERVRVPGGGLLGIATALAAVFATSAYVLALGLFRPIVTGAAAIAALEPAAERPDVRRRLVLLDDAGFEGARAADAFFIVFGCAAAIVGGLVVPLVGERRLGAVTLGLTEPAALWSGLLGGALAIAFAGSMLEVAARAARGTLIEVERQLRAFPRDGGVVQVPVDYTPTYRTLVDLASRLSLEGVVARALVCLLTPVAFGFTVRFLYSSSDVATAALTSFVVVGTAVALGTALAADGAHGLLGAAERESRPRGATSGSETSSALGHQVGSLMGNVAAPAAHLFVKAAAAVALFVAPLLSSP